MLKLVIQTQYKENYAAHDEGYVHGVDEAYWKFKGGSTYVIEDLDFISTEYLQGLVDEVSPIFCYSNDASESYVIDWEMVDHNDTPWESWETPYQLVAVEDGRWTMSKFDDNTDGGYMRDCILSKTSEWTYQDGEMVKGSYSALYTMECGKTVLNDSGLKAYLEEREEKEFA